MTIVAACLKANFSCEWKIFKVIARTLAIIIIEPRENVFYCDFIPDKPSPAIFLFSVEQHIQIIFLLDTRVIVYICASYMLVYAFTKRKKKSISDEKKKNWKKNLYITQFSGCLRFENPLIQSHHLTWAEKHSSFLRLLTSTSWCYSRLCAFLVFPSSIYYVCAVFSRQTSRRLFLCTHFSNIFALSLFLFLSFPFCLFLFSHIEKYLSFTSLCSLYICWTTYKQHWPPRFIPLHINILMAFYRLKLLYISHVFHSH